MRTIEITEVIKTLESFPPRTRFTFLNHRSCGCLYTQVAQKLLKRPNAVCHAGGTIRHKDSNNVMAFAPSHDLFWKEVEPGMMPAFKSVTKGRALKILKRLLKHAD